MKFWAFRTTLSASDWGGIHTHYGKNDGNSNSNIHGDINKTRGNVHGSVENGWLTVLLSSVFQSPGTFA